MNNFNEFIDALENHVNAMPGAVEAAVEAATNVYDRWLEKQIDAAVYNTPLPESMAKRGQERTNKLREGRSGIVLGHGFDAHGVVQIQGSAIRYARRRNYLETRPNEYFEKSIAYGSHEAHLEAETALARVLDL